MTNNDDAKKDIPKKKEHERAQPGDSDGIGAAQDENPSKAAKADDDSDDDASGDDRSTRRRKAVREEADAPQPVASGSRDYGESVSADGLAPTGHYLRIEGSLAAGVTVVKATSSFVTIGHLGFARSVGPRLLLGAEASLWVVPNVDVEGSLLGTITRVVSRRFELGAGVGLHLGNGIGPAFDVLLRYQLPIDPLALYLRYDGALLFHEHTRDGQNTGTVGIEAHF